MKTAGVRFWGKKGLEERLRGAFNPWTVLYQYPGKKTKTRRRGGNPMFVRQRLRHTGGQHKKGV